MDDQHWAEGELLNMIPEPYKIGTKTSTLNETASSYGVSPMPIEQFLPGESPNTANTKLKRKAPETDPYREKKREIDKAYRLRCKEKKRKTELHIVKLTEENENLKREKDRFRKEEVKQEEMVQKESEKIKQLKSELGQLKGHVQRQNVVVDVLSKQLAGSNDKDLRRENSQLKRHINVLKEKINNPESLTVIQLRTKIALLENEKHSLQVIVDALCEKINNDKDQLPPKELA